MNFWALSLRSWSVFDDFRPLRDETYPNAIPLGWAFAPISGDGAALHGGRFNPTGRPALYTSLTQQCAWTEAQQGFAFKAQPVTTCAYAVDCDDIEDLCDPDTCKRLGVNATDLSCPWEDIVDRGTIPPSWELAERLMTANVAGIVVPSFAPGATVTMQNVVFWDWSEDRPHQVRVIDDFGRLPRDRSSWS
ncbi:RES family NAD+ phosphorylase [Loktanella sp. DJP18]|uniref:RES family NAD+ phosphorylase n=1 Tax=Loktanella sp. DJP18 TaxID=3409788 RepID=UPI003BB734DA